MGNVKKSAFVVIQEYRNRGYKLGLLWVLLFLVFYFVPIIPWARLVIMSDDEVVNSLVDYGYFRYIKESKGELMISQDPDLADFSVVDTQNIIASVDVDSAPNADGSVRTKLSISEPVKKIAVPFDDKSFGLLTMALITDGFSKDVIDGSNLDILAFSKQQWKLSVLRLLPFEKQGNSLSVGVKDCSDEKVPCLIKGKVKYGVRYIGQAAVMDFGKDSLAGKTRKEIETNVMKVLKLGITEIFERPIANLEVEDAEKFIWEALKKSNPNGLVWLWFGIVLHVPISILRAYGAMRLEMILLAQGNSVPEKIPNLFQFLYLDLVKFSNVVLYEIEMAKNKAVIEEKEAKLKLLAEKELERSARLASRSSSTVVVDDVPRLDVKQANLTRYKLKFQELCVGVKVCPDAKSLVEGVDSASGYREKRDLYLKAIELQIAYVKNISDEELKNEEKE